VVIDVKPYHIRSARIAIAIITAVEHTALVEITLLHLTSGMLKGGDNVWAVDITSVNWPEPPHGSGLMGN
jgi:hypothetical protein